MRFCRLGVFAALLGAAIASQAETRLIEGRGVVTNSARINAQFEIRMVQVNNNPATGRLAMKWAREQSTITVICEHPEFVAIKEREGRMKGGAKVTVSGPNGTKTWEGTVFFTGVDNKGNGDKKDVVRMRFIRDPWGAPEGDFFFEGVVTDGDLVVKKS